MRGFLRSRKAIGETAGFVTFVTDTTTDRILGCHVVGPEAGNLIHEAVRAAPGAVPGSAVYLDAEAARTCSTTARRRRSTAS